MRTSSLDVLLLVNTPTLNADHPDQASEAGVLESADAVSRALHSAGHRVRKLEIDGAGPALWQRVASAGKADVVFNLFEGLAGRGEGESQVASLIELAGLPLTGSNSKTLALVRDKARTKWLLSGAGLPTPEFQLVEQDESLPWAPLAKLLATGPAIVKPAYEDASLGIGPGSVVHRMDELARQVDRVRGRYGGVLVERFIAGREFNAGILALPELELLPLAEIEFDARLRPESRLVTYDAKWRAGSDADRGTPVRCPADVEPRLAEEIGRIALAAFRATGCRQYARIDLRVDREGRIYILEVNGNPDLSPQAGLARALAAAGHEYDRFVVRLVRHARESATKS
jgi:D-alanine-D-alanine ligase